MRESQKLLSYGFRYFETQQLYDAGVPLKTAPIWYSELEELELGLAEPVSVTIPRGHYVDLEAELVVPKVIEAPLAEGEALGELITLQAAPESGFFSRLADGIYLFFSDFFD